MGACRSEWLSARQGVHLHLVSSADLVDRNTAPCLCMLTRTSTQQFPTGHMISPPQTAARCSAQYDTVSTTQQTASKAHGEASSVFGGQVPADTCGNIIVLARATCRLFPQDASGTATCDVRPKNRLGLPWLEHGTLRSSVVRSPS